MISLDKVYMIFIQINIKDFWRSQSKQSIRKGYDWSKVKDYLKTTESEVLFVINLDLVSQMLIQINIQEKEAKLNVKLDCWTILVAQA